MKKMHRANIALCKLMSYSMWNDNPLTYSAPSVYYNTNLTDILFNALLYSIKVGLN